jgi:hypothetical protein
MRNLANPGAMSLWNAVLRVEAVDLSIPLSEIYAFVDLLDLYMVSLSETSR